MTKFNVGDMICRTGSGEDVTVGKSYKVLGVLQSWVTINNDAGLDQYYQSSMFKLVVTNELQVGETYTSYNGHSWVAIYEEDDLVWMKSPDGGAAYVFKRDGTTISMGSNSGYSINWEATKGPIIEEGVFVGGGYHLSVHPHSLSCIEHKLSVTTVDGVPDWTTLSCKEIN